MFPSCKYSFEITEKVDVIPSLAAGALRASIVLWQFAYVDDSTMQYSIVSAWAR